MFWLGLLALCNIVVETTAAISASTTVNNIINIDEEAAKQALIEERREKHKKAFEEALVKELNNIKNDKNKKGFYFIDKEKAQKITRYLKGDFGEKPDANFKHYIKDKKYNLVVEGDKEVLYREEKVYKKGDSNNLFSFSLSFSSLNFSLFAC